MSGEPPPDPRGLQSDALDAAGWKCSDDGEIVEEKPQAKRAWACFKHSRDLQLLTVQ